jgi:predicted dehydrogenase
MTDQGTHLMDVIQWFLNDGEPPLAAQEHGAVYGHPGWETPDVFCAIFEFPKFLTTWTLSYNNNYEDGWGIIFQGNKGTLLLDDDGAKLYDEPWKAAEGNKPPAPVKTLPGGLDVNAHHGNFFECVRTRKQPHAPIEVGQKAVAGLHLANRAHFAKRRAELGRDYVTVKV